jgi:hypothetical protein
MASSMTKVYCRDAEAALIVCDCSTKHTLQSAVEWKQALAENMGSDTGGLVTWLVANK